MFTIPQEVVLHQDFSGRVEQLPHNSYPKLSLALSAYPKKQRFFKSLANPLLLHRPIRVHHVER